MKQFLQTLISEFSELLYPNLCLGCLENSVISGSDNYFCITCYSDLAFTNDHNQKHNFLMERFYGRLPLERATSLLWFSEGGVCQRMIHNLKYKGMHEIGTQLGSNLGDRIFSSGMYKDIDALIPVPMHFKKQLKRGYNQTVYIAEGISDETNIPVLKNVLFKEIETESQTSKTRQERVKNASSIYTIKNEHLIKGKHIMLIDDVVTTGATLESCALVLLKNGASKISIGTIAMGSRLF